MTPRHAHIVAVAASDLLFETLHRFGRARLRATGSSMFPTVRSGDELVIQACAFDDIQPGHVVVFTRDGRIFAHRVIKKVLRADGRFFVTRGDAHWTNDPQTSAARLLGRVIGVCRASAYTELSLQWSRLDRAKGLLASAWIAWRAPRPQAADLLSY